MANSKFTLEYAPSFNRDSKNLKNNHKLQEKLRITLKLLSEDPFNPSLKTHTVNTHELGKVRSSRVTGDLRLIWDFKNSKRITLILIRLQGHDTVYR